MTGPPTPLLQCFFTNQTLRLSLLFAFRQQKLTAEPLSVLHLSPSLRHSRLDLLRTAAHRHP